jgi:choline-sulfatase
MDHQQKNVSRRGFLKTVGIASAASVVSMTNPSRAVSNLSDRPNVLVIVADDHAAYVCGAYGNRKVQTPNLDRLAHTGVRFTHAYVNCPMCTPSRQSLLTGRLPHSIGVTQLRTALSDDKLTLADLLKEQGYATAAIGKMHFNSQLHHGFDLRLDLRDHETYLKEHLPRSAPEDIGVLPVWRPFKDPARIWLNGSYVPYSAYDEDMPGTWFARQAQNYLQNHAGKPFCLFVSFYEPHSPFHFPIEYRGMYDPATFDVPNPGPKDDWQIPKIFRDLTRSEKQHIIASYYTSVAFLDKNVGLVLEMLDETRLNENTLVIYLGDNGYNLGHHGRFEKHCFFEQSVRVPLVVRLPGSSRRDAAVDGLVEFIDIFPTIAEFCGAAVPAEVEGRSLLPLIEGKQSEGREAVFSEYYDNEEAMLRTKKYKFIYSSGKRLRQDGYETGLPLPGRTRILFNIENDSEEMTNLADFVEYADIVGQLEHEMLRRLEKTSPYARTIPPGLGVEDKLDWYLKSREE